MRGVVINIQFRIVVRMDIIVENSFDNEFMNAAGRHTYYVTTAHDQNGYDD